LSKEKSWKREIVEDAIVICVVLLVVWGTGIGLQHYLQTPTPLLAVESGSMEPVFYRGDLVVVRAVDPSSLVVGDIVIYNSSSIPSHSGGVPIVHRIIEINNVGGELRFITMGDNNPVPDSHYRTADDIFAKVIGSVRYLGFITLILMPPTGLISIIILVVIFLAASLLCDTFAPKKKNEEFETPEPDEQ
jgi:signal peptidase